MNYALRINKDSLPYNNYALCIMHYELKSKPRLLFIDFRGIEDAFADRRQASVRLNLAEETAAVAFMTCRPADLLDL